VHINYAAAWPVSIVFFLSVFVGFDRLPTCPQRQRSLLPQSAPAARPEIVKELSALLQQLQDKGRSRP
jgi:hypothetical protein